MEEFRGILERITFHNSDNGYVVAKARPVDGKEGITVVGTLHVPLLGEELRFQGNWIIHPRFGRQFQFARCERVLPTSTEGIIRFLSSGAIRGVGPVTAARLVEKFGERTLDVLENHPDELKKLDGIGEKKLAQIIESYQEMTGLRDIMLFLETNGVSGTYGARIFAAYGEMSLAVLQQQPYLLAQEIQGIGFRIADRLARSSGLEPENPNRLNAGVFFTLDRVVQSGHVCLPVEMLKKEASTLLQVEEELVSECIERMIDRQELDIETLGGEILVYPDFLYRAEKAVAKNLLKLRKAAKPIETYIGEQLLAEWEDRSKLELAVAQRAAVTMAITDGVMVLTGGPGTGKTTTIRSILEVLDGAGLRVLLAAPTGRAAKRLAETTGREASTIHRLLEAEPTADGPLRFSRNESRTLEADVVIVDESSMLDLVLTHHLILALPEGCRLVLAGDADQLPSVGAGSVLKDIIRSEAIPVTRLTEVFRQAQESAIVRNAHRINHGQLPEWKAGEFSFVSIENPEQVAEKIIQICSVDLPAEGYHPLRDVQVISPMHRQPAGVENLNKKLQAAINPPQEGELEVRYGENVFRLGDKVMQTKNNYEKKVFNGDIGVIWEISQGKMVVRYPDWDATYEAGQMDEITLAYAMSVHKSQGSEYSVVVLPLTVGHSVMLQRNLLYTAVTRAKERVILVGSPRALQIAVQSDRTRKRYSLLAERLREVEFI